MPLAKEDYEEPCCPLKIPGNTRTPIPAERVLDKLDEYVGKNDYESAKRHLIYWLQEAKAGHDERGQLTVLNEQIGLYRKCDEAENGIPAIEEALKLVRDMELDGTVTLGTTLINAATAYKAFGQAEKALPLYRKAKELYEKNLDESDGRLGGLYNNMALTVLELGDGEEAKRLLDKALAIMSRIPNGEAEMAITYCNLADWTAATVGMENGDEAIGEQLERAKELLDTPTLPRNGYYAFVCEKCAPTFGYYGYFAVERELMKRAEDIR